VKGSGKSTLCAALAAHVTAGAKIPGGSKSGKGGVLWLTTEESYESAVQPRLKAAGADLSHVHFPGLNEHGVPHRLSFPSRLKAVRECIEGLSLTMIIMDPLSSYWDSGLDLNSEGCLRPILEAIAVVAAETGCLFLGIRQLRKDRSCAKVDRAMGSACVGHVARSVLATDWPDQRCERRVLRVVNTNLGERVGPLEYQIVGESGSAVVRSWRSLDASTDDPDADEMDRGERSVRETAKRLLSAALADGWIAARVVISEAESAGIGIRTLNTAKAEMGVQSRRVGSAQPAFWEWSLPPVRGSKDARV